jgi:UDP-glucose 4-epimerase
VIRQLRDHFQKSGVALKILVTGGAGFIGSHVVDCLVSAGHQVSVYDNLTTGKVENIPARVILHRADILDPQALSLAFAKEQPELVCHLAAQIDVRKSIEGPVSDAMSNVIGSINVIEAALAGGTKRIVYANSGGAIYGDVVPDELPAIEETSISPLSPYGVSKYVVEQYLEMYAQVRQLEYTSLRLPNVYGPRQDPTGEAGVIAIFLRKMLADEPITVFGDGKSSRDYTYVSDVAAAFLKSASLPGRNVFNIGTGIGTTVLELVSMLSRATGFDREPDFVPPRVGEVAKISLDATHASNELGWRPLINIETGLSQTAAYYASQVEKN